MLLLYYNLIFIFYNNRLKHLQKNIIFFIDETKIIYSEIIKRGTIKINNWYLESNSNTGLNVNSRKFFRTTGHTAEIKKISS